MVLIRPAKSLVLLTLKSRFENEPVASSAADRPDRPGCSENSVALSRNVVLRKFSFCCHSRPPLNVCWFQVYCTEPRTPSVSRWLIRSWPKPPRCSSVSDARVGRAIDDRVRLLADRRQVGDVAVVLVIRRFDQRRALKARVVQAPVVAALDAGAVAGVGQVAIAAAADVRRIVDEHEADRVAARRRVGALGVALILLVLDRAHELLRIERRDVVFTLEPAVAAEEPGAVAVDRAADGERRVERRELLVRSSSCSRRRDRRSGRSSWPNRGRRCCPTW